MNIFMRPVILLLIFILYLTPAVWAQNLIEAKPAELQLLGQTTTGEGIIVTSSELIILYKPGGIYVSGELLLNSLSSEDPEISELLESITLEKVTFETTIPPDRFIYGQETEVSFSSQATLYVGSIVHDFVIDYTISHSRVAETNTFLISGIGTLSLADLGLTAIPGYIDTIRFYFRQNVSSKKVG